MQNKKSLSLTWPIRVESEANKRESYQAKASRSADQRAEVRYEWQSHFGTAHTLHFRLPVVVHLTRIGKKEMDDDNLAGAFKHVRDELAFWILPRRFRTVTKKGITSVEEWVDDSDPRIAWIYSQEIKPKEKYAIRVEIHEISHEEVQLLRDPVALLRLVRESTLDRSHPTS